ncbi:hypothetical protein N7478_007183 [Penicillium angulare]|uniref:uncharacterized protein n=1 Tax=Penicillium angulare TaxID=116970 RepID=UPI0025420394|nr:uncharacterized protein N7478_007183 [Penicillium angulare]KAJ5281811.1 hypothetical protein N7478_007183 [Penicillium angulare]
MSETEQEWKPSGKARPQSTMAQAFSSALDSAFSLDSDVNQLSLNIDQKKQQMIIQSRELEALQERIREAEERLKQSPTDEKPPTHGGQRQTAGKDESS